MRNIVSIQSTVLNDKVGNHAARSILSDKGYNIYEIPTVILTSHKAVKGTLQINDNSLNPWVIFNKVRKTYKLSLNDLTIIGYTPNLKISKSIGKIINVQNRIVLDPVMGDIGIGLYVEKDVANFFKKVITKVKYISANFFEWSYLNNKDVNNNIRFKNGKNINSDELKLYMVENGEEVFLPKVNIFNKYIFATENQYLLYPTNYNYHLKNYNNTFQHGGISMEEMIIPFIELSPKNI